MRSGPSSTAAGVAAAPGRRSLRAGRVLAALIPAVVVAGCGTVSHDNPAFTGPPSGGAVATTAPGAGGTGPAISQVSVGSVAAPHLGSGAGAGAINAAVTTLAKGLGGPCSVATTRSDAALVSFRWTCADRSVATATFSVTTGRRLGLADVLTGGYLAYLSSTAVAQLTAGGAPAASAATAAAPTPAAFSRWDLTPDSLEATFILSSSQATIGFPLPSLAPYLAPGGPLR